MAVRCYEVAESFVWDFIIPKADWPLLWCLDIVVDESTLSAYMDGPLPLHSIRTLANLLRKTRDISEN